jgi:hypothetical protein
MQQHGTTATMMTMTEMLTFDGARQPVGARSTRRSTAPTRNCVSDGTGSLTTTLGAVIASEGSDQRTGQQLWVPKLSSVELLR